MIVNRDTPGKPTQAIYTMGTLDARRIEEAVLLPEMERGGPDALLARIIYYSPVGIILRWGTGERRALEWLAEQDDCPADLAREIRDDLSAEPVEVAS